MIRKFIYILFFALAAKSSIAQELNCQVSVLTPQIQSSDKRIYTTLQTSLTEFMNNTKWTADKFTNNERIECTIQITISERTSNDEFKGNLQVQARRPIFGTSYNSTTFNFKDDDFQFKYLEYQPIEFNESSSNPDLVAVMAFYANMILGTDYDTYSLFGGTTYFQKAQAIVANMANAAGPGWKAFEGTRNRYWLTENMNNPIFKPIRELMYAYHRNGLDIMTKKKEDALNNISEAIEGLRKVHAEKPGSMLMQTLFYAKADEVVNIFKGAFPDQKSKVINTLNEVDPANGIKYEEIRASN